MKSIKYVAKPVKKLVYGDRIYMPIAYKGIQDTNPYIQSTTKFTYMQFLGTVDIIRPDFKNYIGGSYTNFNSFQYSGDEKTYIMNVLDGDPVIVGKE